MKTLLSLIAVLAAAAGLEAATLDSHPQWKYGHKLPELYYEVLAASIDKATEYQAPDGRFRSRLPENSQRDIESFNMYIMQYIYVPALLYVTDNEANPRYEDTRVLEMAVMAGDYLASIVNEDGQFAPTVNGTPTNPLDSHRALYCWAEAWGLLKGRLGEERAREWAGAIRRGGEKLVRDIRERKDRPRYTAPWLGTSPNHFGLWTTTAMRIGQLLDIPEWVELTRPVLARFVREVEPGGYWAEADGPMVSYDYLNTAVAALYSHYFPDPEALDAMRLNTDFHVHWTTPDGVDIGTVDQRNRSHFAPRADWGLFSFCRFPDGRRYARFKLLAALGDERDPLGSLGLAALARLAQDAHYHTNGTEMKIPQEYDTYRHTLDRPAVVRKSGPWVASMCAVVSPHVPYNQFFLDRIAPVSLWHKGARHIIGGGNSKGQPRLATFAVEREDGTWNDIPLDGLIRGSFDSDTMCVAHEGFSFRLVFTLDDPDTARIDVMVESTYGRNDQPWLNLPLRLHPGGSLEAGNGKTYTIDSTKLELTGAGLGGSLAHGGWRMNVPESAVFTWPFYTYTPYGPVRVPERIHSAMGVVSVPLQPDGRWVRIRVDIE